MRLELHDFLVEVAERRELYSGFCEQGLVARIEVYMDQTRPDAVGRPRLWYKGIV